MGVPKVSPGRATGKLVIALATTVVGMTASACFTPLDDGGSADGTGDETGANSAGCPYGGDCNGVYAFCGNNNLGGGVDDSGGEEGAAPNHWWVHYTASLEEADWTLCSASDVDDHDICCVDDCDLTQPDNYCCFIKQFDEPGNSVPSLGNTVRVCLGEGTPITDMHPLSDWNAGEYPGFNDEIYSRCTMRCENFGTAPPASGAISLCDDENWSGLQTAPSWDPDTHGYNCIVGAEFHTDDPNGHEIPWEIVGGPTFPVPLDCDLDGDCVDWFEPTVAPFVLTPESATFIDPETRGAHYLAVEGSGSSVSLDLDMSGSSPGVDDAEPLFGLAEYTALECDDDVCPFFLANLSAYNTMDSWELRLTTDMSTRIMKHVSNVQIDLLQSTLGVRHMGLDKVAFAPGTLRLRVEVEITANGGSTYGDGVHSTVIENVDYVFADYDDGALSLSHSFPVQGTGEGTLTLQVVPDEYPPVAQHDLASTELCNGGAGHKLNASHILSSDPDNDIVLDLWWVDGQPCGSECLLPIGTHQVALEAHDARGAVDRTPEQQVVVAPPC